MPPFFSFIAKPSLSSIPFPSAFLTICSSTSMAPKRRKKMGLTRMDAALDQMSAYGFSRQLVRKTVKNLLKLYGEDGWVLIEENGYKVVLDVLLDDEETAKQTHNLLKDASSPEIENTGNELVTAESYEVAAEVNASLTNYTVGAYKDYPNDKLLFPSMKGSENQECWKEIDLNETPVKSPFGTDDIHCADEVNLQCSEDPPTLSEPSSIAADTPVNLPIVRRRKPCYGWISDDECDEETKFIALKPAT